jgi:hypothetical protein
MVLRPVVPITCFFYLWVLHPVALLSNLVSYDVVNRNKASIRQLSLFIFLPTHYMFRPLQAILRWDIQLMLTRTIKHLKRFSLPAFFCASCLTNLYSLPFIIITCVVNIADQHSCYFPAFSVSLTLQSQELRFLLQRSYKSILKHAVGLLSGKED